MKSACTLSGCRFLLLVRPWSRTWIWLVGGNVRPQLVEQLGLKTSVSPPERAAANAASAAVRVLRAADGTLQRRLAQVSTELLCERAHSQHLAQERQEVAQRERWLSRQVDVAVMVIAALREQLSASENQLEQRER